MKSKSVLYYFCKYVSTAGVIATLIFVAFSGLAYDFGRWFADWWISSFGIKGLMLYGLVAIVCTICSWYVIHVNKENVNDES